MTQIKNVRPSLVLVTDARVRLGPGQVLAVEQITPHLQALLDQGALVVIETKAPAAAKTATPAMPAASSTVAPSGETVPETPPARPEPKRSADASGRRKAEGTADAG